MDIAFIERRRHTGRWDYLMIIVRPAINGLDSCTVQYTRTGDYEAIGTDANDYLSRLGDEGWELASSFAANQVGAATFVFRRPKS